MPVSPGLVSSQGGYYDWLEQSEMVERLTDREDLETARTSPPPGTRANIRGHYVGLCAREQRDILVGWTKIRDRTLRRTVRLDDPFEHEVGGEG